MKKILTITIALLAFNVNAQTTFKGFEIGVQAAMNLSVVRGTVFDAEDEVNFIARPGIFLFGTKDLTDKLYLKPGIGFNFKGGETVENYESFDGEIETTYYKDKFTFLEVPVMVGYKATDNIFLEAGLSFGITLSATSDSEGEGEQESENIKESVNNTELGFHIGGKYIINSKFAGGIRYFTGSNLNKSQILTKVNIEGFAFFMEMKI